MKEIAIKKFFSICEKGTVKGLRECLAHVDVDVLNADGSTGLHVTSSNGFTECVRILIANGANLDLKNSSGDTSLLLALSNGHLNTAMLLLRSGADFDSQNVCGDRAIHVAAREGFISFVHALSAFGCSLNCPNGQGLYPIHLAAKNGHIDVIRYLCLFGCNIEQKNLDGIKAEIMAFKNGHYAAGELLNKLRVIRYREEYISQLMPTSKLLPKYNVKFLGCSGTGKTTLIRSLKARYFSSLFSKSKFLSSNTFYGKRSPVNSQIEMDYTSQQVPSNELPQYEYTQGIEIHQTSFGSGEVNLWDFSGLDTYYCVYDYFLEDNSSLYVILFNLSESSAKQRYQCTFWLTFLRSRLQMIDAYYVRVLLVGTHADVSRIYKDSQGAYISKSAEEIRSQLADEFPNFLFERRIILCDSRASSSLAIKEIKSIIAENKTAVLQNVVKSTRFLESTVQCLKNWRKECEVFPVLPWNEFINKIHRSVNPLAASEHVDELVTQLTIMAEIYYVRCKSAPDDLVVLDLNWLCSEVIGVLLSLDTIAKARMAGCYTEEDFQSCFPHGPADRMLNLLSALQICTKCENDGETEYEFPCYNLMEKLDGLWAATDEKYSSLRSCYGGVRLKAPHKMLQTVFTRLQVQFRRATVLYQHPDSDLYQWFQGSKLCIGDMESFITLEKGGEVIDVKVRGTNSLRLSCFYFLDEILSIINQTLNFVAPGLHCQKYILSSRELKLHKNDPYCWLQEDIFLSLMSPAGMNSILRNPNVKQDESVLQLLGFDCENVIENITIGGRLSIKELSGNCLQSLAQLLDPPDSHGKDWCLLAVKLGLSHKLAALDNEFVLSKTLALIEIWGKSKDATVGNLIKNLMEIGREDAARIVMLHAPLYKIHNFPKTDQTEY